MIESTLSTQARHPGDINGRCAFGTVAEMGSGIVSRLGTLGGFVAGTSLGA